MAPNDIRHLTGRPLKNSSQRRLDQALTGKAIADDILIFGCGANDEEVVRDRDEKLVALPQRCRDKGVKFNRGKLQLRLKEVTYMGHVLSADGLQPDP